MTFSKSLYRHSNEAKVAEEYCGVLTGGGAVMLLPIRFQFVGDWI
jgi:hypothetical protein